jgi:phosphoglycolate phosphatase-like HAD superfamily hydrolase
MLDARDLVDDWTDSSDVEATKPDPDLVAAAIEKGHADNPVMLGDSPWDCEAAARAGVETVAVMTGGFSEQELTDAGAVAVFESLQELRTQLAKTPLS